MLSELELLEDELNDECEYIDFCPRYREIISDDMRWRYCHTNEKEDCVGRRVFIKKGVIDFVKPNIYELV